MPRDTTPAPRLKDWFDEALYRSLAGDLASLSRGLRTVR
jgi:hypothetical protein